MSITIGTRTYSRGEISRGTGLSMSHVSRIFSGKRAPSVEAAELICAYLGITLDELMRVLSPVRVQRRVNKLVAA